MSWFRKPKQDVTVKEPAAAYIPMETPPKISHHLEGARRDAFIVDLIRRFGLLTSDLIQQRLAIEQFEGLTSQHNILNRLKILTERREIYNLGHIASGHIVYGAKSLRGNARRHISHDLGVARFGITLDGVAKLENWCCDQSTLAQEFRSGERPFVPDARFLFNGFQTYLEYHTGSQDERIIVEKMRTYKKYHEQVKQLAKIDPTLTTKLRVLFVCQREGDVEKLLQVISKAYGESILFWIGAEAEYKKDPAAIAGSMWRAGNELHCLY